MKIICIGRNYTDHISELRNEKPEDPVIFLKPDTAILLKKQPFFIPDFSEEVHHEVEVLVKIKKVGKHIQSKFAHKYYDEIGLGIDFTARDLQKKLKEKGLPWEKAKAFDGAAVIGENWLNKEGISDLNNMQFSLEKNGTPVQKGNTALMLWKIDELIAYISQFFTLKIGDVIFTGTPSGVGKVVPEDRLTGHIENKKSFQFKLNNMSNYNLSEVKEMADGDEDFMKVVVQTFLEEIPPDVESMNEAIDNDNPTLAYQYAHKMKPNLQLFGLELMDEIQVIEAWAKEGKKKDNVSEAASKIGRKVNVAQIALKRDFELDES